MEELQSTLSVNQEIGILKNQLCRLVEQYRDAMGARNIEVILSSTEQKDKCDITIRF